MDLIRKSVQIELKKDKEGAFIARIATLNVIDKDGDVTINGAFPDGREVLVSAYQHESWGGALPVGKAVLRVVGDEVLAEGEFNLKTQTGREHYEAVKFSGGLQEWSYGFIVKVSEDGEWEGQKVRILKEVEPYEISPVLLGAGIGTATLAIKNDKTTYADEAESVLAAVSNLAERTKSLADVRRKEGRDLSSSNKERIGKLIKTLSDVVIDLKELTTPSRDEALVASLMAIKEKSKFYGGHYIENN